jgi:hypothetical protein
MLKITKIFLVLLVCFSLIGCGAGVKPLATAGAQTQPAFTAAALDVQKYGGLPPGETASAPPATQETEPVLPAPSIESTLTASHGAALTPLPASPGRTPPPPDAWKNLPVIPTVSETARQIYQRGISMGRDPHAFSKVGDCQSITTYFLSDLENPALVVLGSFTSLQQTINWFRGSFDRESLSVKGGFNAAAVLSPLRADPKSCKTGESPVACEYRLHNPSIALISLEEWWAGHPENYEKYMRQIIEYSIQQGVVPVVATKADNLEGNQLINQTIARLAWEYDIPLWNFWAAVQPLSNHGLISDGFHLTHGNNFNFTVKSNLQSGWTVRNLTGLEVLDIVRRSVSSEDQ